jgi:hypothetical protein
MLRLKMSVLAPPNPTDRRKGTGKRGNERSGNDAFAPRSQRNIKSMCCLGGDWRNFSRPLRCPPTIFSVQIGGPHISRLISLHQKVFESVRTRRNPTHFVSTQHIFVDRSALGPPAKRITNLTRKFWLTAIRRCSQVQKLITTATRKATADPSLWYLDHYINTSTLAININTSTRQHTSTLQTHQHFTTSTLHHSNSFSRMVPHFGQWVFGW